MLVNIHFFFLWRAKAQYSDLLFLFLNFYTVLRRAERDEMRKIKFEATQIHLVLSDVLVVVCYIAVFRVVTQRSSLLGALRDDTKNCCL